LSPSSDSTTSAIDCLRDAEQAITEYLDQLDQAIPAEADACELSVVMPCLNEADTLATCIDKAQTAMRAAGIVGEVIVADNGSTDGSIEIARELGARVVPVAAKGYGSALMGGIAAARGSLIIMGDADDSYDFLEIPKFVAKLRDGHDLVQGCRLPAGGGTVMPGAMPVLHRWWGNPMFSWMARQMFGVPVHDIYCGLRGFTRRWYQSLDLRSSGMEFATEMIIKSSLMGADIAEVPTTLHPDGRKAHAPHLRTFRDGWRTLRFFLMYSPRWLFLVPGLMLVVLGFLGYAAALPGVAIAGATLGVHTLLVASMALVVGSQLAQLAVFAKTFAITERLVPEGRLMRWFNREGTLERGLIAGCVLVAIGLSLIGATAWQWGSTGFGALEYARTMRCVIPGTTMVVLGTQTIFSSFFLSILRMARR
jgi:glycosyltransferase involved in cell wall biosynthesis